MGARLTMLQSRTDITEFEVLQSMNDEVTTFFAAILILYLALSYGELQYLDTISLTI